MVRRTTVKRRKNISKHIKSRHKKLGQRVKLQSKIEGWDKNLSYTSNLKNLGMTIDVNEEITARTKSKQEGQGESVAILQEPEELTMDQVRKLNQQRLGPEEGVKRK